MSIKFMSKIGSYDYPDTQIGTLLKALEILVSTFGGEAKEETNFASAIGHKNTKSGGYLQKIADLRRYGFMEKGRFVATSLGKRIIKPLTPSEKQNSLNESIISINLWRDLKQRFNGNVPSSEEFRIHLAEVTGDRDKSIQEADTIRNIYIDAMKYYTEDPKNSFKSNGNSVDDIKDEKLQNPPKRENKENLISASIGEVFIEMPRDKRYIKIAQDLLQNLNSQIVLEEELKKEQKI